MSGSTNQVAYIYINSRPVICKSFTGAPGRWRSQFELRIPPNLITRSRLFPQWYLSGYSPRDNSSIQVSLEEKPNLLDEFKTIFVDLALGLKNLLTVNLELSDAIFVQQQQQQQQKYREL